MWKKEVCWLFVAHIPMRIECCFEHFLCTRKKLCVFQNKFLRSSLMQLLGRSPYSGGALSYTQCAVPISTLLMLLVASG